MWVWLKKGQWWWLETGSGVQEHVVHIATGTSQSPPYDIILKREKKLVYCKIGKKKKNNNVLVGLQHCKKTVTP